MPKSAASVATAHGPRYLQQLCKHWGHRFDARFDAAAGAVDFGGGEGLELAADAAGLRLVVQARDAAALGELEQVVARHLERFAFRETLVFRWHPADRRKGRVRPAPLRPMFLRPP